MNNYIIITFLFIFTFNLLISEQNTDKKPRIIIFNKKGQSELIKSGELVSVVYGPDIRPEYYYIAYSTAKNNGDYVLELKSNESLLKEISILRNSIDSLSDSPRNVTKDFPVENRTDEKQSKDTIRINRYMSKTIYQVDSLQATNEVNTEDNNPMVKLPRVRKYLDAVGNIVKSNKEIIARNEGEYNRNNYMIDSLEKIIEYSRKTNTNLDKIDDYLNEINKLKEKNKRILIENENLTNGNLFLNNELKAKLKEYNLLMNLLYLLIALIILVVIIAVIIYVNYKQKKSFNNKLNEINKVLEKSNNELFQLNSTLKIQKEEIQTQNNELIELNQEKERLLNVIRKELDLASKYVLSLIPKPIQKGKIKTDWIFIPSKELGGDSFGYNMLSDDEFAFYLLDVSGHGVGPALHSLQVLNVIQNQALPNVNFSNPEEVITSLNKIFQMEHYKNMYFTIVYCVYNNVTKKLKYSSAGHPPVILSDKNGIKLLEPQSIFVGAILNTKFGLDEIEISEPANFYLFSDGVYELEKEDGTMFTFDEFTKYLISKYEKNNSKLETIYSSALKITNTSYLEDDYSILKISIG